MNEGRGPNLRKVTSWVQILGACKHTFGSLLPASKEFPGEDHDQSSHIELQGPFLALISTSCNRLLRYTLCQSASVASAARKFETERLICENHSEPLALTV